MRQLQCNSIGVSSNLGAQDKTYILFGCYWLTGWRVLLISQRKWQKNCIQLFNQQRPPKIIAENDRLKWLVSVEKVQ